LLLADGDPTPNVDLLKGYAPSLMVIIKDGTVYENTRPA